MAERKVKKTWTYTVKPGDGLMAIVRREFKLKDPKDTQEINRLVDLIVAQNHRRLPKLTRDRINVGDVLKLRLDESHPEEKVWTYKIKPGDGLMAIVRDEFDLTDTKEINRLVDRIVKQNQGRLPKLTRDRINVGDVLKLRY